MKKISIQGSGGSFNSPRPFGERVRGKKALSLIIVIFCLMTGTAWAAGEQVADYTAYPPFLPRVTSPNILFMLDYSSSMVRPAYGSCTSITGLSDCRYTYSNLTDDYDSTLTYSGYFNSTDYYSCTTGASASCTKSSSSSSTFYGNYLNWLAMTQFDVMKKVIVGGDITASPETGNPTKLRSILLSDISGNTLTFRKTMNIASTADITNCTGKVPNSLCNQWPTVTYSWIDTPNVQDATVPAAVGKYNLIFGEADAEGVVRTTKLPFAFTFYGTTYPANSDIYINENGWFSFTSTSTSNPNNEDMPSSNAPNNIIAPYWDDLNVCDNTSGGLPVCGTYTVGSSIKAFTDGTAPSRKFVITFEKMSSAADAGRANPLTFQVVLYEGSNHIVFQYKEVQPAQAFGAGKTATIGVENSDGTGAKKYSYNGSTLLSNSLAVFATPHIAYRISPNSSSPTAFYPSAPLGTSSNAYNVNIDIARTDPVSGSCPVAYPYPGYDNNNNPKCYNHNTLGLLQDFRDGELAGTLGFRLAIMQLNGSSSVKDGGNVVKHFNQKETTGWSSLMAATRGQAPTTVTPLAEALQIAEGYFKQDTSYNMGLTTANSWTNDGTGSTCVSTGNNYDPYCFQSAAQRVSCCKSFVLMVSSGNYSNDNRTNIYGDAADSDGQLIAGAWRSTDDAGNEGTKANGGWLDNVAYKAHTTDWRSDLEGTQNLTIYGVNTFGSTQTSLSAAITASATTITVASTSGFSSSGKLQIGDEIISYTGTTATTFTGCARGVDSTTAASRQSGWTVYQAPVLDGAKILKKAAKYGGFDDKDGSTTYTSSDTNGNGVCDAGEREDDLNCDGNPDTYFEASGGSDLKTKIIDAVTNILKSSSSGTSVSVLSTSASGEGAIYQAYFYPARIENTTEDRDWPGYLRAFFIDKYQNMRDDSSGGTADAALVMAEDRISQMCLNTTTNEVKVKLFADANADGSPDTTPSTSCPGTDTNVDMDSVLSIWEAGNKLAMRNKSTRNIFTWADLDGDGVVDNGDFGNPTGEALTFVNDAAHRVTLKPYLRAADDTETGNIIDFIRGNAVTGYRNRCITTGSGSETGCTGTQHVWALGDIVYSTPTLVSGPGEKYDQIYGDADYRSFTSKYKKRRSVIYTGANDGMLHAFNGGVYTSGDNSGTGKTESGWFTDNSSSSLNGFANGWGSVTIGDELWGFIPHDNLPTLAWLACNGTTTDPSVCGGSEYTHVYYVDQRPKVTDVRIFNNTASADCSGSATGLADGQDGACHPGGWGTILIMGMRLGGGAIDVDLNGDLDTLDAGENSFRSAFYVFDVTDPEKKPKLLWRFYNTSLGFTTSYPAIAKVCSDPSSPETCKNTEKWYMVVGSGPANNTGTTGRDYGSVGNAQPLKVFVVDLVDGSLDQTIQFETGSAFTMMGDPIVVDADLNFTSDVIYIGANITTSTSPNSASGRVYRINTYGTIPTTTPWDKSTLYDPVPGTAASTIDPDPDNGKDMGPLLVSPSVAKDSKGNLWVFFGTGKLRNSIYDLSNSDQQRFYGIKDACWKGLSSPCDTSLNDGYSYKLADLFNSSNLAVCSLGAGGGIYDTTTGTCGSGTQSYGSYSSLLDAVKLKKGWYLDLNNPTDPAAPSERVLSRSVVLGGLLLFTAYKPTSDMCSVFGDSALYSLYYETGTAYIKPTVGTTGTGATETVKKSLDLGKGMPTAVGVAIGETVSGFVQKSTGEIVRVETQPGLGVRSGAASWREKTGGGGTSEIETIYKHIVK